MALTQRVTNHQAHDLICFSHLRWSFVFQRPQHLMVRFACRQRVFFVEEPIFDAVAAANVVVTVANGVHVVVPHLPASARDTDAAETLQRQLLSRVLRAYRIEAPIAWFYTPMSLFFCRDLHPCAIVYDCMDELSGFKNAPADLVERERELLARADVVFTGGHHLYEAKRMLHENIHPFPSSVDVAHFAQALGRVKEPEDQQSIPHPRLGFCGVIDERMNLDLVRGVAEARPDWHLVMIGPVVKIDSATLPQAPNIHYLGMKSYDDLPRYMSGWDAALLPFAHNESTKFISPTKTPEYLAAGCPVVSTSVRDVVRPYGEKKIVEIADTVPDFVAAIARSLSADGQAALERAAPLLATMSWDRTFEAMAELVEAAACRGVRALQPFVPVQRALTQASAAH